MQVAMDNGFGEQRQNGLPVVRFRTHPVQNPTRSQEEGRPVFDEVEFITIQIPGDRNEIIDRPVSNIDAERFKREYLAWKSGVQISDSGTPLEAWPSVTRSQVEELKHFGIKTVEQLASMADSHAHKFMAFNTLRNKARDYIQAAKGNAVADALRSENDELKNRLAAAENAIKDQAKLLEELKKRK